MLNRPSRSRLLLVLAVFGVPAAALAGWSCGSSDSGSAGGADSGTAKGDGGPADARGQDSTTTESGSGTPDTGADTGVDTGADTGGGGTDAASDAVADADGGAADCGVCTPANTCRTGIRNCSSTACDEVANVA